MLLRIGVNVGDIIHDKNRIYGDGVNIAARLETLAEPGGLCISRDARNQVRDKLPWIFTDLGEQSVKNIARPIRVFGLTAKDIIALPRVEITPRSSPRRFRRGMAAGIAARITGEAPHEIHKAAEEGS